jgi:predicted GNAT family acetyltransferase
MGWMDTAASRATGSSPSRFLVVDTGSGAGSSRFELRRDGELVSYATYRADGAVVVVPHVETLRQHRGNGLADRLLAGVVEILREDGRTIVPLCRFAAGYFRDHPEHGDVVGTRVDS